MAIAGAMRASGIANVHYGLAAALVAAIVLAGWTLGMGALRSDAVERQRLALAGGLLIAAWAVITIFAAMGPPHLATLAENTIRYPLILMDAIAIAGGLVVLREALSDAGERFYSTLGFAAIMLASPLYIIFAAVQLGGYRAMERGGSGQEASGIAALDELSLILLFFGVVLTYLATAAFAASLARTGWIGRTSSRVFVGTSLFAALCVGIRATEALASVQNPMWGFQKWYAFPGFVFLIPAVPWIMPCLIGIVLLRRAGAEQLGRMAA